MEFSKQEYWSRLPFPSPEDLPYPGITPASPALADGFCITKTPGKPLHSLIYRALTLDTFLLAVSLAEQEIERCLSCPKNIDCGFT